MEMRQELKSDKRPVGVTAIAVLDIVGGVLLVLGALIMLLLETLAASLLGPFVIFILRPFLTAIIAVFMISAVIDLLLAWGLWNGKNWARLVTIILSALGIIGPVLGLLIFSAQLRLPATTVWAMLQGSILTLIVGIVINVLFIYILMRRDAKAFFQKQA